MLTHQWVDQCKSLSHKVRKALHKAIQFDAGDLDGIPDIEGFLSKSTPLPFPTILVQFEISQHRVFSHILILFIGGDAEWEGNILTTSRIRDTGKWVTTPLCEVKRVGESFAYASMTKDAHTIEIIPIAHAMLLNFLHVLNCSNVVTIDVPAPRSMNLKRRQDGKFPIFEHKTLVLKLDDEVRVTQDLGGTHASPRVHLRRGHIRTLASGKQVWVQPCVVGSGPGIITKDYKVVSSKKHPPSSSASL